MPSLQHASKLPSHILLAGILQMVVRNGIAGALRRPKPCHVEDCNNLRERLLQDSFFDRDQKPEELGLLTRPGKILFVDLVVLMARLLRVLQQRGELTEEDRKERVEVRKEVLGQPFFDRELSASINPFADPPVEDEGCVL